MGKWQEYFEYSKKKKKTTTQMMMVKRWKKADNNENANEAESCPFYCPMDNTDTSLLSSDRLAINLINLLLFQQQKHNNI